MFDIKSQIGQENALGEVKNYMVFFTAHAQFPSLNNNVFLVGRNNNVSFEEQHVHVAFTGIFMLFRAYGRMS